MYHSLEDCLVDLEKHGMLIRIKEEVDPHLEMSAIHLRVFEQGGPALMFENVKGSKFRAASNIFGDLDRTRFIFRKSLKSVEQIIRLKGDPMAALRAPFKHALAPFDALKALPRKVGRGPVNYSTCKISELPQIVHWPDDGGAFVTLPAVYTEDQSNPGIMRSNLGMYRIQLSGNDYIQDEEIGLHYQLHRGIGIHQTIADEIGQPLKVSIFVGGSPSLPFSAVMPLPEGISELTFAGLLGKRRFRYTERKGYTLAAEADFVITGYVMPQETKDEGPFGDHLGYYSLKHPFPLMHVESVYHRKNAIWPFTVVGRPPQEDTQFGAMIHSLTDSAIPQEIPGVKEVHAVDAAGVHPLLLAVGSERYTPYLEAMRPSEILTQANRILGTGQLSLAKFLFMANGSQDDCPKASNIPAFFNFILEHVHLERDLHFYTKTSIDTLDYSGDGLNTGSKVVVAAGGARRRKLSDSLPRDISWPSIVKRSSVAIPGVILLEVGKFEQGDMERIISYFDQTVPVSLAEKFPIITLVDDADFVSEHLNNWLWVTFTRANPASDIYGVQSFVENKHWGCRGPLVIDARIKPHHAPPLVKDVEVERKIDRLFRQGASLSGLE
jgi:4-hydroxy-3-polyprenylbenzoate decarboxylase